MNKIFDFEQEKIDRDQPALDELIYSFTAHNCDRNRPYREQQPLRAQMEIKGLTRRDICDCMVLGMLECRDVEKYGELPRVYVSDKGNSFKEWDLLEKSGEGFSDSYIDAERITYNELYGLDLDGIGPIAAVQNMACHLERRMNVFPALLDGRIKTLEDND